VCLYSAHVLSIVNIIIETTVVVAGILRFALLKRHSMTCLLGVYISSAKAWSLSVHLWLD